MLDAIFLSEEKQKVRWIVHSTEILKQPIPINLLDSDGKVKNVTDDADISMNDIS